MTPNEVFRNATIYGASWPCKKLDGECSMNWLHLWLCLITSDQKRFFWNNSRKVGARTFLKKAFDSSSKGEYFRFLKLFLIQRISKAAIFYKSHIFDKYRFFWSSISPYRMIKKKFFIAQDLRDRFGLVISNSGKSDFRFFWLSSPGLGLSETRS